MTLPEEATDGVTRRGFLERGAKAGGVLTLGASLPAALVACGGSGGGASNGKTIRFANWASAEALTATLFTKFFKDFESKTGIHVDSVSIPFLQYQDQLTTLIAAGQAPDLAQSFELFTAVFQGIGALRDVSGLVSPKVLADLEEADTGRYGNQLNAIPWVTLPAILFWQKDLAKQAGVDPETGPKTWNEFEQLISAKYPANVSGGLAITSSKEPSVYYWWYPLLWNFGGDVVDGNGQVVLDQDPAVHFGEWAQEAYAKRWMTIGINGTEQRVVFAAAKAAAILDGPFGRTLFAPPKGGFDASVGAGLLPAGPVRTQLRNASESHQFAFFKQSNPKSAESAVRFAEYMLGSGPAVEYYANATLPPASKTVLEENPLFRTPFFDTVRKGVDLARNPPITAQFHTVTDTFMGALQATWNGANVRTSFKQAADQIRTILHA